MTYTFNATEENNIYHASCEVKITIRAEGKTRKQLLTNIKQSIIAIGDTRESVIKVAFDKQEAQKSLE